MFIGIDASHAVKEQRTGVEEACWQIIENLKTALPADARVVLYSHKMPSDNLASIPANWEWKILRWPLKKIWTQGALAFELLRHQPDVYFSPGQLLPWFVPKKTFVFVHDSAFLFFKKAYSFWGRKYLRLMNWWIVRRASTIITSTDFNLSELVKYYGGEIATKIRVVPLAFNRGIYNKSAVPFSTAELADDFGITKTFVLFVGRLEEKKNLRRLIQAFNWARKKNDFQLVLSGRSGYGFQVIKQEIDKSPYKNDIIIPGWVEIEDLPRLLKSAQVSVLVSLYEGFGLPILEAMSVGTPVLASDLAALCEVGGGAALYVDPKNIESIGRGLNHLFSLGSEREKWIERGQNHANDFSWEKTSAEIAKMLLF